MISRAGDDAGEGGAGGRRASSESVPYGEVDARPNEACSTHPSSSIPPPPIQQLQQPPAPAVQVRQFISAAQQAIHVCCHVLLWLLLFRFLKSAKSIIVNLALTAADCRNATRGRNAGPAELPRNSVPTSARTEAS